MSNHLLARNPQIFISDEAVAHAKRFFEAVKKMSPQETQVLTVTWCTRARELAVEFAAGLDELKDRLPHDAFARELTARADVHATPIPPHVSLGTIDEHQVSAIEGEVVALQGMKIVVGTKTFLDVVGETNVIVLSHDSDRPRLTLAASDAEPRMGI